MSRMVDRPASKTLKMLETEYGHYLPPRLIVLIPEGSQSNVSLRLHKLILQTLRPAYSEIDRDIVPDLPIVKRPPLPTAILTPKPQYYLPTAGMLRDIRGAVKNYPVDNNDCDLQISALRISVGVCRVRDVVCVKVKVRTEFVPVFSVSFLYLIGRYGWKIFLSDLLRLYRIGFRFLCIHS